MIFFDVRKAFDQVFHQSLLQQLQQCHVNFDPYLLRWLYPIDHSLLQLKVSNQLNTLPIMSGVPQGSVLGPLRYSLLCTSMTSPPYSESDINIYADDITLLQYRIIKTSFDYSALRGDVDSIGTFVAS